MTLGQCTLQKKKQMNGGADYHRQRSLVDILRYEYVMCLTITIYGWKLQA